MIDSTTQLRHLATDDIQFRKNALGLVNFLNSTGCTTLLAYEPNEPAYDMSVGLAVDRGLESGTTTLLSGPAGTGKTTLGMQFLVHMAIATQKCTALFSFEESPSFIATRSHSIGMPIDAVLASDRLRIVRVNPLEPYPDEFLSWCANRSKRRMAAW
ncbi:hypothetical protein PG1C_03065 [Rugosibacter aromaticivorans]|uniref:KaiC-like domain-containing protein n=1 Tax=Rugosibacter aromaticivorans TaxID=1565605 RepID=A0A0C5JK31_9PROT|nr:ATPase domain-containing protein [Rugosibacter aromaticivorans]AJP47716.1 hypothetical protein PG1C_03065 [Rugosibacter aromaticivorans]